MQTLRLHFCVLCISDVQLILERLGSQGTLLKKSVLIGCTEQNQVQFCLDVGEDILMQNTDSTLYESVLTTDSVIMFLFAFGDAGELDQAAVEEVCDGKFVDLKKSFFVLRQSEAPLLAKVVN